jgi:DNA primase
LLRDDLRSASGKPLCARDLKGRVDLIALAGRFTRLRRSRGQFVGLCPFHSERHPSFYVHPQKQVFRCFGCGAGGDIFDFVMCAAGCDFLGALEIVAEFSEGVASESEPRSGEHFRASEGAQPLSPAQRGGQNSQSLEDSRTRILAALDATDRRLARIAAANAAAPAALATGCEPERGGKGSFT